MLELCPSKYLFCTCLSILYFFSYICKTLLNLFCAYIFGSVLMCPSFVNYNYYFCSFFLSLCWSIFIFVCLSWFPCNKSSLILLLAFYLPTLFLFIWVDNKQQQQQRYWLFRHLFENVVKILYFLSFIDVPFSFIDDDDRHLRCWTGIWINKTLLSNCLFSAVLSL